jgi:hypothetical protein
VLRIGLGVLIVLQGVVAVAIGAGTLVNGLGVADPSLIVRWPAALGRTWLLGAWRGGVTDPALGGALWIASGLAIACAGLGWLGVPRLREEWPTAVALGAGLGLVALALSSQPHYALGALVTLVLLAFAAVVQRPVASIGPA